MVTLGMSGKLILSEYGYQPLNVLQQASSTPMTSLDVPYRPKSNQPPSAGGTLRLLPVELHMEILDILDLESVLSFAQVSLVTRDLAYSHATFRNLVKWASGTIKRLRSTGMLSRHSLVVLQKALQARKCISCGALGAFLFLPMAQRCCHYCLTHRPYLRLIPLDHLSPYLGIPKSAYGRCEHIAVKYYEAGQFQKTGLFTTLASALSVCRAENSLSSENLNRMADKYLGRGQFTKMDYFLFYLHGCVQVSAGLEDGVYSSRLALDPWLAFKFEKIRQAKCLDRFYTPFPFLTSPDSAAFGVWCLGCRDMRECPSMQSVLPPDLKTRAYQVEELLEHVKNCYGVRQRFDCVEDFKRFTHNVSSWFDVDD